MTTIKNLHHQAKLCSVPRWSECGLHGPFSDTDSYSKACLDWLESESGLETSESGHVTNLTGNVVDFCSHAYGLFSYLASRICPRRAAKLSWWYPAKKLRSKFFTFFLLLISWNLTPIIVPLPITQHSQVLWALLITCGGYAIMTLFFPVWATVLPTERSFVLLAHTSWAQPEAWKFGRSRWKRRPYKEKNNTIFGSLKVSPQCLGLKLNFIFVLELETFQFRRNEGKRPVLDWYHL